MNRAEANVVEAYFGVKFNALVEVIDGRLDVAVLKGDGSEIIESVGSVRFRGIKSALKNLSGVVELVDLEVFNAVHVTLGLGRGAERKSGSQSQHKLLNIH
ncbi:MAG: hypothetical protein K2K59_00655 [Muribaculaceae bacterium]|nr:hypothetical protein [Muribaculaceae bacterium]